MLENVKSSYILKIVFSFVVEKLELKLVKYNKNLQQKINICIINYIHFKGKYIIYESKGKGKEYNDNNKLIFEVEYLNSERNGKGKEYDHYGQLKFEGEYLSNKRNGKGKEYYDNGELEFEGEFLDNKKLIGTEYDRYVNRIHEYNNLNGKGKEYDSNNNLIFEGEYLNGKRNGKGKEY